MVFFGVVEATTDSCRTQTTVSIVVQTVLSLITIPQGLKGDKGDTGDGSTLTLQIVFD